MKAAERKTRKELAALIRQAADRELSAQHEDFSCYALDDVFKFFKPYHNLAWDVLAHFIPQDSVFGAFGEFPHGAERQGARFFWLDFLAEGIENGCIDLDFVQ